MLRLCSKLTNVDFEHNRLTWTSCSFNMGYVKPFVGRDNELRRLEDLSKSGRACLVVIKGRRRIGKSRLAEEFGKDKVFLPFSGLAPVKGVGNSWIKSKYFLAILLKCIEFIDIRSDQRIRSVENPFVCEGGSSNRPRSRFGSQFP